MDNPKVRSRTSKSSSLSEVLDSRILSGYYGVIKPSDLHPAFVLGLRLMPRPLIAYEEGSNDHDSVGSRRGQPRPQPAKAEVEEQ